MVTNQLAHKMIQVFTRPHTGNLKKISTESFSKSGEDFDSDDESEDSIFNLGNENLEHPENFHHPSNH